LKYPPHLAIGQKKSESASRNTPTIRKLKLNPAVKPERRVKPPENYV